MTQLSDTYILFRMSKSRTIISGIFWTIIQNFTSILYGVVSVPFLINYFGNEEYGLIGYNKLYFDKYNRGFVLNVFDMIEVIQSIVSIKKIK